jgi:prepilin-type N-terminal cleavage/methylation domain-containing protein
MKMKRKGFTLVELLVVISIIALLMAILMPALAQVKRLAQRIMCGTNLAAIGKSMVTYASDNEEYFPRSAGRLGRWSATDKITNWDAQATASQTAEVAAFGTAGNNYGTITSCFYLLIKYTDGTPKQFICKGDIGAVVFKLSDAGTTTTITDLTLVHDFGDFTSTGKYPGEYCSYSYHMPFNHSNPTANTNFPLTSASSSASPVAADRNPFIDKNALNVYLDQDGTAHITGEQDPSWLNNEYSDTSKVRNAAAHQREGQNVLYVDTHVDFEKAPNCGIENDNIYICWVSDYTTLTGTTAKQYRQLGEAGGMPYGQTRIGNNKMGPYKEVDAFLVNEHNNMP